MTFDQSTSGTGIESLYQVAVSFMRDRSFILPLAGVREPKLICMFQIGLLTRGGGYPFKKIMLVDDEEDIVLSITASLEHNGFEVDGFTDPRLALEHFTKGKYVMVIIDIRMPEIDGFEFVPEVRRVRSECESLFHYRI